MKQQKDIFETREGIIMHGCNAQGKMGRGFAKDLRVRFPTAYLDYKNYYQKHGLKPGEVVWSTITKTPKLAVANAITQEYYGDSGKKHFIESAFEQCLIQVSKVAEKHKIPVVYPKIGAGLGGGDWNEIEKMISFHFKNIEHKLFLPLERERTIQKNKI